MVGIVNAYSTESANVVTMASWVNGNYSTFCGIIPSSLILVCLGKDYIFSVN